MKFNLDKRGFQELERLFMVRDENMTVGDILSSFLSGDPSSITPSLVLNKKTKANIDSNQAFYELMMEKEEIDYTDKGINQMAERSKLNVIDMLSREDYIHDPYYADIHSSLSQEHDCYLKENYFQPYEAFLYKDSESVPKDYYREINHVGVFNTKVPYYLLMEKDKVWMSITPHEMNTMKDAVCLSQGKVLCLGLGLGYFAYLASLRKEVSSVTVIENDPDIISLFNNKILPQMETKDKIHVIQGDAYDYMEKAGDYDFVFADLWHEASDGLPSYLKLKKTENKLNKKPVCSYWIEPSILIYLRRILIDLIQEEKEGSRDQDYLKTGNEVDNLMNKLHFFLKDKVFMTYSEIREFLSDDSLKELAGLI